MASHASFAISMSGGGLSAVAYAGFVEVLRDHGLQPNMYAGISGGALLAALLASGLSSAQIIEFFRCILTFKILNTRFTHFEIVDHNKLVELIREQLPLKNFEQLDTPVMVFATDLGKQQPVLLNTGDIASAVVASCSIFPLMAPVKRRGLMLSDGGFTTYYGAKYIREVNPREKVIGIDVTGFTEGRLSGALYAFYRQISSSATSNARYELQEAPVDVDLAIRFPSPTAFTFYKQADHLVELGRKKALQNLRQIKRSILV